MENEIITLILADTHYDVEKRKLASRSRYFESLFSHNFNDSHKKEHVINYDIAHSTLQNFIDWIHEDEYSAKESCRSVKPSMVKFKRDNFMELLKLLQLSVLFMVDSLTDDVVDVIVLHWLEPEQIIDIWLLAQELSLNVLRDIALAVCLDRFTDLPMSSIVELPLENMKQMLENTNVRATKPYLQYILREWADYNMTWPIIGKVDIPKISKRKLIQCLVGYKSEHSGNKKGYVYCWDGNQLTELVELKDLRGSGRELVGMQVTGRGFSIYIIGGERGLGTGQFNKTIWRYCLISKKWYYYASLPNPRRHMVVAFLSNCLFIVGGVGRHRLKLSSVDVLNIHTGQWSKAADVPEDFAEVPPYCVMKRKLFVLKSSVYIFCPEIKSWKTITLLSVPSVQRTDAFIQYGSTVFMTKSNHKGQTVLFRINNTQKRICDDCSKMYEEHTTVHTMNTIYNDETCQLKYSLVAGIGVMVLGKHCESCKHQYLQLHNEIRNDMQEFTFNPRLGSFYMIDPSTLNSRTSS